MPAADIVVVETVVLVVGFDIVIEMADIVVCVLLMVVDNSVESDLTAACL